MLELDMAQRRQLVASAHHLNPVVMIGKDGLTENVISELDRSLLKHELIKVKILEGDRDQRTSLLEQICFSLNATPVRQIGKILIIYRINPDKKIARTPSSDTTTTQSRTKPKLKPRVHPTQSAKKTRSRK
ncbi:ribosome assembly RNA-binding protein YhbY [Nitrosomonas sp.]|uniref:ribosome assembly RNA-binding protein YhbY n=1 Tax=Nitrosomonas sp. TaxID=42353 RepID=UPI0025F36DAA|nr:ribosome assembly RNA-binding protein YhbY [Nitrosomonas sp.]MCC6917342.1 ribosome assembly RNA-binding protein YhbY [Nitrosomonas sp.]